MSNARPRRPLRAAFFSLALFAVVEACSGDDDAPFTPLGPGAEAGAPATDGDAPRGDGGTTPGPTDASPTEPTGILALAEPTAARAYSALAVDDDVVVAGADNFDNDAGDRNAIAFRSDLDGRVRWAKRVTGDSNDQFLTHVVVGKTVHGFGVTRTVFTGAARNTDVLWASFDVDTGAPGPLRHFGTTANEDVLGSVAVADGIVIVGVSGADAYIAKVANGAVAWARTWATPGTDSFRWVGAVGDKLVAVGFSTLVADGKIEPIVAVFDQSGGHVRSRRAGGAPADAWFFSARALGDDLVAVGQSRPGAGQATLPFAARFSLGDGAIAWTRTYGVAETTGNSSFRATAVAAADEAFGMPETLVAAGLAGGRGFMARVATSDGQPLARLVLRAPANAAVALDREVLWERRDRGFGALFYVTPAGSALSSLGLALTNRLLDVAPTCVWGTEPTLTLAAPQGLAMADVTATVAPATFTVAAAGASLAATDLALTRTVSCGP